MGDAGGAGQADRVADLAHARRVAAAVDGVADDLEHPPLADGEAVAGLAIGKLGHAHGVPFVGSSDRGVTLGAGPVSVVAGEVSGVSRDYEVRTQLPNTCSRRVSTSSNIRATTRTDVLSNMCSPDPEQGEVTMSAIVLEAVRSPHTEEPARSLPTGRPRLVLVPTGRTPPGAARARATRPPLRLTRFGRLVVTPVRRDASSPFSVSVSPASSRRPRGEPRTVTVRSGPDPVGHRRPRAARADDGRGCRRAPGRQRAQLHARSTPVSSSSSRAADPGALRGRPTTYAVCRLRSSRPLLIRRVGSTFSGWR